MESIYFLCKGVAIMCAIFERQNSFNVRILEMQYNS